MTEFTVSPVYYWQRLRYRAPIAYARHHPPQQRLPIMTWGLFRTADEAAALGEDCSDKVFVVTGAYSGIGV